VQGFCFPHAVVSSGGAQESIQKRAIAFKLFSENVLFVPGVDGSRHREVGKRGADTPLKSNKYGKVGVGKPGEDE
jgi:hypothetical protein